MTESRGPSRHRGVYLADSIWAELASVAARDYRSINGVIRIAIVAYLRSQRAGGVEVVDLPDEVTHEQVERVREVATTSPVFDPRQPVTPDRRNARQAVIDNALRGISSTPGRSRKR